MPAEPTGDGGAAEAAALQFLQQAGLRVLARNARSRHGELDLVMDDAGTTVFVEVRLRRHSRFGGALASVDRHKCRRLVLAAGTWLAAHPARANRPCRFDVVTLTQTDHTPDWLRDAFRADDC